MKEEKIILNNSDEAAFLTSMEVWVTPDGRVFNTNEEELARYCGSTHHHCKNNPSHPIVKNNSYCPVCYQEERDKKYGNMPKVQWDEKTPIVMLNEDRYFFSKEALMDYCKETNSAPASLKLILCKPNFIPAFSLEEHCTDIMADDVCFSPEIEDAVEKLNNLIREHSAISWEEGDVAVIV